MKKGDGHEHWNEDRNRHLQDDQATRFGYGGHFGAGGSYGSFGGPASSRLNIPEQRNQDYYRDDRRSGLERQTGGHRGKGPRGYHRTDERILEDVNERLSDDAYVDASDIEVKIEKGTVILSGHVPDRIAKHRAEDITESVSGVSNVENRLHIGVGIMENAVRAITSSIGDVTVGHNRVKNR